MQGLSQAGLATSQDAAAREGDRTQGVGQGGLATSRDARRGSGAGRDIPISGRAGPLGTHGAEPAMVLPL